MAIEKVSDNFKYWGQEDVSFSDLTKSFDYYERVTKLTNTSASLSNIEIALDKIIAQLKNIDGTGTYRNTVAVVSKPNLDVIKNESMFPQLLVYAGDSSITSEDMRSGVFKEVTDFNVEGWVKTENDTQDAGNLTDAMESLIHDVKKCLLSNYFSIDNINDQAFLIDTFDGSVFKVQRTMDLQSERAGFLITFKMQFNRLDTFDARFDS